MSDLPTNTKDAAKVQTSPLRSRRSIFIYAILLLFIIWPAYYLLVRNPATALSITSDGLFGNANLAAEAGQNSLAENENEHYKGAATPAFNEMIQLLDLPEKYMPETGKNRKEGRLVIVGDVHGMKDDLVKLLDKVKFDKKRDHLILAGDMISKGPDSAGVVDLAMKLGATGVRGNHEDRILLVHKDMSKKHLNMKTPGPEEDVTRAEDGLEELSFSKGDYTDRALVRALGEERIRWLQKCPVILRVGQCGTMGEVVVVHAGLAPGVKLESQDPAMVMNMRSISKDGVPSDERDGKSWRKAWNKYQKSLPKKDRSTVIYGHDSHRGLQIEKYSMGIDTNCVKGGRLTAVVIEGKHTGYEHRLVDVNCKDGR